MNFFKTLLASVLGTFFALFLLFLLFAVILVSSSTQPEPHIRANTVLTVDLGGTIPVRTLHDPLQELISGEPGRISLEMLKRNLEKAASDDRIAGVRLNIHRLTTSWATLESARGMIENFRRESGKFVYSYSDDLGMNEAAYFLASASDSIFFPPETYFELNGFSIQAAYYREMLDKIGVSPEIVRVGDYKSAVEPFLATESSPENREQLLSILQSVTGTFVSAIEVSRGVTAERLDELMNEIPANSVERALEEGLIDAILHPRELERVIAARLGLEEDESPRTVSMSRYNRVSERSAGIRRADSDGTIAVIHASGMIVPDAVVSPFSSASVITARKIDRALRSALENDDVRAIVLHIDSGGGAVSTSELIHARILDAAGEKPLIAYLGSVAASGGYYIAMGADSVVASANTITGSIGIYNMLFDTSELYNDRLGIYFETFKTHEHADLGSMTRPLTDSERAALQRSVEDGYETFLERVGESRGLTRDQVHEVGQGRVWTGREARDRHLVDLLGDLETAVAVAAEKAGLENYELISYPERKELFELLLRSADASIKNRISSMLPWSREADTAVRLSYRFPGMNWAILPVEFLID